MKILLADDSNTTRALIEGSLHNLGHEVVTASNGQEAIELFQKQRPDLIILDVVMEGMSGFECAKKIRSINTEDWVPIIFLSGSVDDESIAQGIDAGGDDYLTKPFSDVTLAAKIKAMQRISDMRANLFEATQKLMVLSSRDTLTEIYNRFQFNKTIVEKIAQSARYNRKLAILFLDLDKFKAINDSLGHRAGDLLLIEVTKRLQSCLRIDDFLARMGGDEFAIIFSDLEEYSQAGVIAQKIIDVLVPPCDLEGHQVKSSLSIGIACYPKDGTNQEELLKNADIAMYHAKKSGGNRYQYFNKAMSNNLQVIQEDRQQNETPLKSNNKLQFLVLNCLVNNTRVCFNLQYVKKVLPLAQLEIKPHSPDFLVGLLNLANKYIPVIDIGARLNLNRSTPYSLKTPILLCSDGANELGLIIDNVLGLEEVSIQEQEYIQNQSSLILATPTIATELSLLINMNLIFAVDLNNSNLYIDSNEPRIEAKT